MRARWCLWASAGLAVSVPALAAPGGAQDGGYGASHAVVQQVPENSDPSHALDAALARLAHNPRDGDALIAAGNAALTSLIGSVGAAVRWTTHFKQRITLNPRDSLPQHEAVYRAIAAGDADAARTAMVELLRLARQDVVDIFA